MNRKTCMYSSYVHDVYINIYIYPCNTKKADSKTKKKMSKKNTNDKKGLKRYAKNQLGKKSIKDQSPHPHFLCEDCGISKCLPIKIKNPTIPDLIINSAEQLYLGQCGNCQA